jgi:prepilin-type N-terminal cleavage/methylation domain-containing protein
MAPHRERAATSPSGAVDDGGFPDDSGFTMIEMLVTIVLMGMTVVAVLVGVQTTIHATVIDREHAIAFAWLQSASDEIYRTARVPCTDGLPKAIADYDTAAKKADVPSAWSATATIAVTNVEYLGKVGIDDDFEWSPAFCFEGVGYETSPLYTQRVTIQVTSPDVGIVKTIQMVKSK